MTITQADVNKDICMLASSIEDENRPLVSPIQALKISMLWPLSCAAVYAISVSWAIYNFTPHIDHFDNMTTLTGEYGFVLAACALAIVFCLFIGASLYGPALAYLSLSKEARDKSLIIGRLKKVTMKLGMFFLVCNIGIAVFSIKFPSVLVISPFSIIVSFLITQGVVGAEVSRYGISAIFGKLNKLAKKI
ncbi:hypothetical protein [Enterobacter sp. A103]|uniref:hypothetical protein n=1 Tax=Enterobacter sp. A103 TaxID=3102785 RepID=UPI002ACA83BB|nr:hypothetical protein [Enterobacter sp. A103]MDZ5641618.1 hypothetical protein [Enterobacter sp. A103]